MSVASAAGRMIARHWALLAACAVFLVVGALALDDYGVALDASAQRRIGDAALNYLGGDSERALDQVRTVADRYYGAAFEAPLVLIERIFFPADRQAIFFSRQLLTHLFFLAGGVFCYLLVWRLSSNKLLALIATVFFLLHPRIYAHSFFNSKDVPFLAMFMVSLYLTQRAFRRDTLAAFLLCGVGVGLLVNLRIMGIVLFAAVLALRALDLLITNGAAERKHVLLTGGAFALAAILTFHSSMPVLWTDPIGRFAEMIQTLRSFSYAPVNLFQGEWLTSAEGPPLQYFPVWIGITTPPMAFLAAMVGAVALVWQGIRHPRDIPRSGKLRFSFLLLVLIATTVIAVFILEDDIRSGWRHLYFLYAPMLLLAVYGLQWLTSLRGRWMRVGTYALAGASVAVTVVSMVRIHPYQDSYFNAFTDRTTPERLASRYVMNYWRQSVLDTLANIVGDHPSGRLFVAFPEARLNSGKLSAHDRERLTAVTDGFRSGENNFHELRSQPCPLASPAAIYVSRVYANTLHCVVDPVAYFGELRRQALATEPLHRSRFTAHRLGNVLVYLRDRCSPDDTHTRTFLHVFPADPDDLPPRIRGGFRHRFGYAFERLDFDFPTLGVRIDGDCVAVAPLPHYPIARIRTGQYTPEYAETVRRQLGESEPWVRAPYDIHLDPRERQLTYIREEGCTGGVGENFFLHVYPVDTDSLPAWRREAGFDVLDTSFGGSGARTADGACVVVAPLPAYPIASVHTGAPGAWQVRFAVTRVEVDVVALGTPLARSVFDIHRDGDALVYVREGCTDVDAEARFGLHLYPVDADDLPDGRRAYGFANRDFFLGERGERDGGRCVAVVPLPAWPVASVHTGQYDGSGRRWWVEFALPAGE